MLNIKSEMALMFKMLCCSAKSLDKHTKYLQALTNISFSD